MVRGLDYESGLKRLKTLLGQEVPSYLNEFHTLEARLLENLRDEQLYGSNQVQRSDRAQIVAVLNDLTLRAGLEVSFNDLCRVEEVGDTTTEGEEAGVATGPKYQIHVEHADQVTIGDEARAIHQEIHVSEGSTISHVAQAAGDDAAVAADGRQVDESEVILSLRRQLTEARGNLLLIEERKAEYVLGVEIPLQLVREERRLRDRIVELERQLLSSSDSAGVVHVRIEVPTGVVPLGSPFYVERVADVRLKRQLERSETITTIRGARQTGKTSLLVRAVENVKERGALVIYLDFQQAFDQSQLSNINQFLKDLAYALAGPMQVSYSTVDSVWEAPLGAKDKMTRFVENAILQGGQESVVLVMDEADVLLQTSFYGEFFGLLRAWHNRRAFERLWKNLSIVIAISTHPSLLIDDIHQSPFNVGLTIRLGDFSKEQVEDLNQKHGGALQSQEIASVMELLGGHPYLIRQALYTLVSEAMIWPELAAVADREDGPFGSHLRYHLNLLHNDEKLMEAMCKVVVGQVCPESPVFLRLSTAGLVRRQDGQYVCRYGLYKKFFRSQLL